VVGLNFKLDADMKIRGAMIPARRPSQGGPKNLRAHSFGASLAILAGLQACRAGQSEANAVIPCSLDAIDTKRFGAPAAAFPLA
jgi:hypothetical protein